MSKPFDSSLIPGTQNNSISCKRSANLTASFLGTFVALSACVFNLAGRFSFESELFSTLKLFGLSVCLLCSPEIFLLWDKVTASSRPNIKGHGSDAYSVLLAFCLVLSASYSSGASISNGLVPTDFFVLAASSALGLSMLLRFLFSTERPKLWWFIPYCSVLSIWCVAKQFHPLFFEEVAIGRAYVDTLFDCCLTNMISTFNISTPGYDGIRIIHYHVGPHWLASRLAALLHIDVLHFLGKGQLIIFFPLMLKTFLSLIFDFADKLEFWRWESFAKHQNVFWLVLLIGLIGILPSDFAVKMAMSWYTYLLTGTYTIALTFLFLTLSVLVDTYRLDKNGYASKVERYLELCKLLILIPLLSFATGMMKQSILYCLMVWYVYLFLRLQLYSRPKYVAFIVVHFILSFCVIRFAYSDAVNSLNILDFFKLYVSPPLLVCFPFCYYFWLWLFLFVFLLREKLSDTATWTGLFLERRLVLIESLIVVVFASQIPPNIIAIQGGSGVYFLEPPHWILFALSLATLPYWIPRSLCFCQRHLLAKGFLRIGAIMSIIMVSQNIMQTVREGFDQYIVTRGELALLPDVDEVRSLVDLLSRFDYSCQKLRIRQAIQLGRILVERLTATLPQNLEKIPTYRITSDLSAVNYLPVEIKERTLMYIPHADRNFWALLPCRFVPIIAPSLTGMASLAGLPPPECPAKLFGVICYPSPRSGDPFYSRSPVPLEEVAKLAEERKFFNVLIYDHINISEPFALLNCKTNKTIKLSAQALRLLKSLPVND